MKKVIASILFESLFIGSFLAWRLGGSAGAENLFLFIAWGAAVPVIIACLIEMWCFPNPQRKSIPEWRRHYNMVRTLFLIVSLAWIGHYWLAAAWCLAWTLAVATTKEVKADASL